MEVLKDKFVLLDCNILIYASKYKEEFKSFYEDLKVYNIKPAIDQFVKLEFLRSANTQTILKAKIEYLELYLGGSENKFEINLSPDILIDARRFSNLYHHLNLKKQSVSIGDCIIAANLKKYSSKLFLATANNNDFPLIIFDRLFIKTFEIKEEIINVGFYKFSETKYNNVLAKWDKS